MANRWLFLLIGIALTQGSLALSSPLTTLDEEWANFNEILRDPAYRLPTTTVPRHYAVTLAPYFDNVEADLQFTFDGEVNIYISPTEENVNEIVIHCNDLTIESVSVLFGSVEITTAGQTYACEMPYSFLRIPTTQALQLNQEYVVSITFRGNLQTNMRGFYRSWYDDSTGRRWMGTTQFQPGHARQAFPCYDEPGFKATFDISIVRDSDFSPTISNMPIASSGASGTRVIDNFHTTPRTSTYLLAFIVSHYDEVATNNNNTRPFSIYARDNVGETGEWSLEIGELLLDAMERYTGYDYYTMADNMNMKQAAIPDFSAGAMENWGLLTYREALILYDPLNSNHFYKQRVANIVSHEIAHMWFGNLVTCAWWDNLWLNEGFARFYQYYLTGSVAPDLGYEIRFIVEQVQTAMFSDSIDSAHALTNPNVNDPTTVSAHFSTITYAKGAAVLRMTQHLLGEDTYVKALRSYISQRAFDVAEPHHLFEALDAAAAENNALANYNGITIDEYFRTWSEKGGHPLLTVTVDQRTGRMVVYQARWERNTGVSSIPSVWYVPITWTRAGDPDFEDLKPSQIITAQATTVDRGTIGNEWVIFNKQETGFYRVNYDVTNWALITLALRSENRTVIHELNRAQIVDDLFALARANVLPYQRIMNVLSFLEYEDAYAPWIAAISGFNFVLRRLAHDEDNLQKLKDEIIRLSAAVTARLGYAEIEDEPYMDGLLRLYVMEFLCDIGHEECVSAGVASFQGWTNGGFVPANMRPWVYCVGLRNGNAANFTYFWNRYLQEDLANEAVVMLQKAGCTTDQASLEIFLNAITDGQDTVRAQDAATAWNAALVGNEENTMRVFYWLQNNLEASIATFGAAPVNALAQRLLNEEQIAEFQEWLDANQETLGSAYNTGVNAIAIARENLAWSGTRMPELYAYLETGYVEDVIDDIIDVEEETVPEPEPVPDSANLAALGFVSLLAVAIVNFVA